MTGLRVNVLDLLRNPGARRHLQGSVVLVDVATSTAHLPDDADVAYDLTLEAHGVQVMVTGAVSAPWEGACRRCLEPATGIVHDTIREVFERDPTPDETWPIEADQVDLAPVLIETIVLGLPLAPLCSPDCAGPDPDRFPTAGPDPDGDLVGDPPRDPRWAALDQLRFDGSETDG